MAATELKRITREIFDNVVAIHKKAVQQEFRRQYYTQADHIANPLAKAEGAAKAARGHAIINQNISGLLKKRSAPKGGNIVPQAPTPTGSDGLLPAPGTALEDIEDMC
jgi:hypothetical protein